MGNASVVVDARDVFIKELQKKQHERRADRLLEEMSRVTQCIAFARNLHFDRIARMLEDDLLELENELLDLD